MYIFSEAKTAFDTKDFDRAKKLFLTRLNFSESYLYLGKIYFHLGDVCQAIHFAKEYLARAASDAVENIAYAYDLLGQTYELVHQDEEALLCYDTATALNPACASSWHNLGLIYLNSTNVSKAKTYLENALTLHPTNPLFLHSFASYCEKYAQSLEETPTLFATIRDHFDLAIKSYNEALTHCSEKNPLRSIVSTNLQECLAQYGHHLFRSHELEKAIGLYSEVVRLNGNHSIAFYQIGRAYIKQKSFGKARQAFIKIIEKSLNIQDLADAWLNIAYTHRMEQNWEEAKKAITFAKQLTPQAADILEEEKSLVLELD